jgi:hypothetical protein
MIKIGIDINARLVQETLRQVRDALDGDTAVAINRMAGESARDEASEYHREYDAKGLWKGKRYLGTGQRAGEFGSRVARGWMMGDVTKDSATLYNNAEHFAFKVTGGTITPKRAKALTIPLIAEARGLYARDYVRVTGRKLFISKSKNALLERIQQLTTGSRGRRGQAGATIIRSSPVRAVYALMKSVTMRPWPEAMPSEDRLADAYVRRYTDELLKILKS